MGTKTLEKISLTMKIISSSLLSLLLFVLPTVAEREMIILVGEPSETEYQTEFTRQAEAWQQSAESGKISHHTIGLNEPVEASDLEQLQQQLTELKKEGDELWIVMIGHGAFDGKNADYNLRGKDLSAKELSKMLKPFKRKLILLNLFSASAPFARNLNADNRVIIAANRSNGQRNYSRFGEMFANTLQDPNTDLDLDGSISLLEQSLVASAATTEYYKDVQRIIPENAIIDDNGDGQSTQLSAFTGLYAAALPQAKSADGKAAQEVYLLTTAIEKLSTEQRKKREAIEVEILDLKKIKNKLPEDEYYKKLESLMLKMAKIYGE